MNRKNFIWGFLLLVFIISAKKPGKWELIQEEDNIKVYKRDMPNSKVVAFKGETIFKEPIRKIYWVIQDAEHEKDWNSMLMDFKILEQPNKQERTQYQSFDLPWPITDRDFVYHAKEEYNKETGVLKLVLYSVEHPKAPKTIGVRGTMHESKWVLTPMGEKKTHISVEIYSDPNGLVPKWLVNFVQKSWPHETLTALKKQLKKDFVQGKEYKIDQ